MNSHSEFTYKENLSSNDALIDPTHNEYDVRTAMYVADIMSHNLYN